MALICNSVGDSTIGGTAAGAATSSRAADRVGLTITVRDNLAQGNFIGTDLTGTIDLGNFGGGIEVKFGQRNDPTNNTIGGTAARAGNTIAFNPPATPTPAIGVYVSFDPGNPVVLGNSIFGTHGHGIACHTLPYADLTAATSTSITGTHSGPANTTYRLEFFATPDTGGVFDNAQGRRSSARRT